VHGGNAMGEALTGVRMGRAIEPRNTVKFRSPTLSAPAEGNTGPSLTPGGQGPAGSKNLCTCVDFSDGNREIHGLAAADGAAVRARNPWWESWR
jgi:hypothetical protein